jgi:hypothetical protein
MAILALLLLWQAQALLFVAIRLPSVSNKS